MTDKQYALTTSPRTANIILERSRSDRRADRLAVEANLDECTVGCALLQGCHNKFGGANMGIHELFTPKLLTVWIALPSDSGQFKTERDSESWKKEQQMQ